MRLAAGLLPDPLGELQRFHRPPSRNRGTGPTSKGKEGKRMGEREGRVRGGDYGLM